MSNGLGCFAKMANNHERNRAESSMVPAPYSVQTLDGHCPYCAEPVDLVVDLSAGSSCYIEDCQVCCQPMTVSLEISVAGQVTLNLLHEDEA